MKSITYYYSIFLSEQISKFSQFQSQKISGRLTSANADSHFSLPLHKCDPANQEFLSLSKIESKIGANIVHATPEGRHCRAS
jgi:hypothetical protein